MKSLLSAMLIVVWTAVTAAPSAPKQQIPITTLTPVIDGRLDDEIWSTAAVVSGFTGADGEWVTRQTSVWLSTDGEKLYFAFKCRLSGTPKAVTHDVGSTGIFRDESVELFMTFDVDSKVYYHLSFNAVGSRYSARCGKTREVSWQPPVEVAAGRFDGGWILEGSLPLAAVNAVVAPGKKWKMNFGRNCLQSAKTSSSWTGQTDFNRPELFGEIMPSAAAAASFELLAITGDHFELLLRNSGGIANEFQVELSAGAWRNVRKVMVNMKSSLPLKLDFGFRKGRPLTIKIDAAGVTFDKTVIPPSLDKTEFALRPERYYCDPEQKELEVLTEHPAAETDRIAVTFSDGCWALRKFEAKAGTDKFTISLNNLQPGRYQIAADCLDRQDRVLASDARVVFIADVGAMGSTLPARTKFTLDGRVFMMDGKPFFPFMRTNSKTAVSLLELGAFNVIYGSGAKTNAPRFGDCGLPAILIRQPFLAYVLPDDEKTFNGIAAAQSEQGNFLFRRLRYEIGIKLCNGKLEELNQAATYRKFYRYIREKFPVAPPVSIQFDGRSIDKLNDFAEACDVMEVARWTSSYARNPIRHLVADLKETRVIAGNKPLLWWIGASIPHHACRNAENLRAATYLALMHDANGIVYHMGHDGIPAARTRLWSVFRGLGEEMDFLYPRLISGRRLADGAIKVDSDAIALTAFVSAGKLYILAVNLTDEPVEAAFELNAPTGAIAMPLEQNRHLKLENGRFADRFTRYEPHVYVLSAPGINP